MLKPGHYVTEHGSSVEIINGHGGFVATIDWFEEPGVDIDDCDSVEVCINTGTLIVGRNEIRLTRQEDSHG